MNNNIIFFFNAIKNISPSVKQFYIPYDVLHYYYKYSSLTAPPLALKKTKEQTLCVLSSFNCNAKKRVIFKQKKQSNKQTPDIISEKAKNQLKNYITIIVIIVLNN